MTFVLRSNATFMFDNFGLHVICLFYSLFQKHFSIYSFKACFLPNLKIYQKFVLIDASGKTVEIFQWVVNICHV